MSSFNIEYRAARQEDLENIQALNSALFHYEEEHFGPQYNLSWSFSQEARRYFEQRIQDGNVFIACENEKIIAYVCGGIFEFSSRAVGKIGELENIYVAETHRGNGIGKKLYSLLLERFLRDNVTQMRVRTLFQNASAQKFYKSLGFGEYMTILEMKVKKEQN